MAMIISELKVVDGYGKSLGWVSLVDKNRLPIGRWWPRHNLPVGLQFLVPKKSDGWNPDEFFQMLWKRLNQWSWASHTYPFSSFSMCFPRRNSDQLGINSSMGTTHQVCSSNLAKVPKAGSKAFHEDHFDHLCHGHGCHGWRRTTPKSPKINEIGRIIASFGVSQVNTGFWVRYFPTILTSLINAQGLTPLPHSCMSLDPLLPVIIQLSSSPQTKSTAFLLRNVHVPITIPAPAAEGWSKSKPLRKRWRNFDPALIMVNRWISTRQDIRGGSTGHSADRLGL